MSGDDLEWLMQEPPNGWNHGRQRSHEGGWIPLGIEEQQPYEDDLTFTVLERQSPRRKTHKPEETIIHGRRSSYVNGCRCEECKAANSAYFRRYNRSS